MNLHTIEVILSEVRRETRRAARVLRLGQPRNAVRYLTTALGQLEAVRDVLTTSEVGYTACADCGTTLPGTMVTHRDGRTLCPACAAAACGGAEVRQ